MCLCHVMRQAESSRDTVQRRKNSCLRDPFVFLLWHTSRHQPIAVIGGRCRSRADNLQPGTVEAGRVRRNILERKVLHFCLQVSIPVISTRCTIQYSSASESALNDIITMPHVNKRINESTRRAQTSTGVNPVRIRSESGVWMTSKIQWGFPCPKMRLR